MIWIWVIWVITNFWFSLDWLSKVALSRCQGCVHYFLIGYFHFLGYNFLILIIDISHLFYGLGHLVQIFLTFCHKTVQTIIIVNYRSPHGYHNGIKKFCDDVINSWFYWRRWHCYAVHFHWSTKVKRNPIFSVWLCVFINPRTRLERIYTLRLSEYQGTACLKQARYLMIKWLEQESKSR